MSITPSENIPAAMDMLKKLSCRKLMLDVFIDMLIEDTVPEYLLNEYYELNGNKNFAATYFLFRDMEYLQNKLYIINETVALLRNYRDVELYSVLEFYGFDFDWDKDESLDRVIKRSKSEAIELLQLQDKWNKQPKSEAMKPEEIDDYFGSWLDALSDEAGYVIERSKITVADFCRRCVKLQEKANKKR